MIKIPAWFEHPILTVSYFASLPSQLSYTLRARCECGGDVYLATDDEDEIRLAMEIFARDHTGEGHRSCKSSEINAEV